jgi:hypothetical protein
MSNSAWTVDDLRHQLGASEHMLGVTIREFEANPTTERAIEVNKAAGWVTFFRDELTDRLQGVAA